MLIVTALVLAVQRPPARPAFVNEFPASKTSQTLSNAISCSPSNTYTVNLRWRFRQGLMNATVRRNGVILPRQESRKLVVALGQATDLLYVQMGCSGSHNAKVNVVYVDNYSGHFSTMMLAAIIGFNRLEIIPPDKVLMLP